MSATVSQVTCARRVAGAAVSLALVLGVLGVASSSATPVASRGRVGLAACGGAYPLRVKPREWSVGCTSGSATVTRLHWRRWGKGRAVGRGVAPVQNCSPSCATPSHFARYSGRLTVSRIRFCRSPQRGRQYTRVRFATRYPRHNAFHKRAGWHSFVWAIPCA